MTASSPFQRKTRHTSAGSGGFSLVEILVSLSIFAIVILIAVGTLIVMVHAGTAAQKMQTTTSNLSFALDTMSRTIRTGYDYYCVSSVSSTLPSGRRDCTSGAGVLVFTDGRTGDRTAYRYNATNKTIEIKIENGSWLSLTSANLTINDLTFVVRYSSIGDNQQPYARILITGESADAANVDSAPFFIQTQVVSRILDL